MTCPATTLLSVCMPEGREYTLFVIPAPHTGRLYEEMTARRDLLDAEVQQLKSECSRKRIECRELTEMCDAAQKTKQLYEVMPEMRGLRDVEVRKLTLECGRKRGELMKSTRTFDEKTRALSAINWEIGGYWL